MLASLGRRERPFVHHGLPVRRVLAAPGGDAIEQLAVELVQHLVQHLAPLRRHLFARVRLASALVAAGADQLRFHAQFVQRSLEEHDFQAKSAQREVALGLDHDSIGERSDVVVLAAGQFQERPDRLARLLESFDRPAQFLRFGPARARSIALQDQGLDAIVFRSPANRPDLVEESGFSRLVEAQVVGQVPVDVLRDVPAERYHNGRIRPDLGGVALGDHQGQQDDKAQARRDCERDADQHALDELTHFRLRMAHCTSGLSGEFRGRARIGAPATTRCKECPPATSCPNRCARRTGRTRRSGRSR